MKATNRFASRFTQDRRSHQTLKTALCSKRTKTRWLNFPNSLKLTTCPLSKFQDLNPTRDRRRTLSQTVNKRVTLQQ